MARIAIQNLPDQYIEAKALDKSILQHFHDHNLDWMHACGGKGRCTTCKFQVVSGAENLSSLTDAELRYRKIYALKDNERLACQTRLSGDIDIRVPEEYKLPHVEYRE